MMLADFFKCSDFSHPLLSEPFTPSRDSVYHYEYSCVEELFYSAIFVYKTLLHTEHPHLCVFKINPSVNYAQQKIPDTLNISINEEHSATESITIPQLNRMISAFLKAPFNYSDDLIIDDTFTMVDLPSLVNGDALYFLHDSFDAFFKNPADLSRLELRYISPVVGFGVFCKQPIKQDDFIGIYAGVKHVRLPTFLSYAFKPDDDCLNMILDARYYGNITRFINHAPNPDANASSRSSVHLFANSKHWIHTVNGISFIVCKATRDIIPGEQLLVDYGPLYFHKSAPVTFKKYRKNRYCYGTMAIKKRMHLRVMAENGVLKAQRYLQLRMMLIILVISVLMGGLHLMSP